MEGMGRFDCSAGRRRTWGCHRYTAPFGLAAEYTRGIVHLGTGAILGPLLYFYFKQNLDIIAMYVWSVLKLFRAINARSGYGSSFFFAVDDVDLCSFLGM